MLSKKITPIVFCLFIAITIEAQQKIYKTDSTEISQIDISEVVVKASKNYLKLKELPASVSILTAKSISENEINTLSDISSVVPNLFMPDYGSKLTSPIYLRGIGSKINSPSIGLYVDGIPYYEKATYAFDFFDIDRIEVLHGPQGTMYGRNTMGGIINIATKSPLEYQGGIARIGLGNYGTYRANAGYYNKLGEQLAYSLALNFTQNDGFYTNDFTNDPVDEYLSVGIRNRLIWKPINNLTLENILSFEQSGQGGYPYAELDSLNEPMDINYNQYSSYYRNLFSNGFIATYSNDYFEIKSTTALQNFIDKQEIDQDFSADSLYFVTQELSQTLLSQEFIAQTKGINNFHALIGVYGFSQIMDKTVHVNVYRSSMWYDKIYANTNTGAAVFGQFSVKNIPINGLSFTAGLRIDSEEDHLDYLYERDLGGTFSTLVDTSYPTISHIAFLPKISISYATDIYTVYGSLSSGYKAGGFNSTFERAEHHKFENEESWGIEAGAKASFFDNQLHINGALFATRIDGQQVYESVPSGRGQYLTNAGTSNIYGSDINIRALFPYNFHVTANYGFTKAWFDKYHFNDSVDYSDNTIPFIPRQTISAQIKKLTYFGDFKTNVSLIGKFVDEFYWNAENSSKQEAYFVLDLKAGIEYQKYMIDFWIKNLTNAKYNAFYFESFGKKFVQTSKPLHFGVNLTVNF